MSNPTLHVPSPIGDEAIAVIFTEARTSSKWLHAAVSENTLRELYDLLKLGPTSANQCPARFVFITSTQARDRLIPTLMPGNVEKTQQAPVTVIVAYDTEFYEHGPTLYPRMDVKPMFEGNPEGTKMFALQNANMQAAYLIIAARALGLDAGPMGGFSKEAVDEEFFPSGKWKSFMLINLGYGDRSELTARLPRLEFDQAAEIL